MLFAKNKKKKKERKKPLNARRFITNRINEMLSPRVLSLPIDCYETKQSKIGRTRDELNKKKKIVRVFSINREI